MFVSVYNLTFREFSTEIISGGREIFNVTLIGYKYKYLKAELKKRSYISVMVEESFLEIFLCFHNEM